MTKLLQAVWQVKATCFFAGVVAVCLLLACEKEVSLPEPQEKSSSLLEDVKDIMESIYFWADHARAQSLVRPEDYPEPQVREYIQALKSPEDRFTFILTAKQSIRLQGMTEDTGLMLRYLSDTLWVAFVEKGSVAEETGFRRGQWIKSLTIPDQNNIPQRVITTPPPDPFTLNTLFQPTSEGSKYALRTGSLTGPVEVAERGSNKVRTLQLRTSTYSIQAVDTFRILARDSKKIGYLHFTIFTGEHTKEDISTAFLSFRTEDATELIIDLRYNRGGLLSVAEHFLNAVYSPAQSTVMYRLNFNSIYRSQNRVKNFSNNLSALNPTSIYFLIDASTASASELLINSLLPFFPPGASLYTVGRSSTGKNVGSLVYSLPLERAEENDITHVFLPICFSVTNGDGVGDYAEGFKPDYSIFDGLHYELGDEREAMLAAALYHIEKNVWPTPSARARRLTSEPQLLISDRSTDKLPPLLIAEPLLR